MQTGITHDVDTNDKPHDATNYTNAASAAAATTAPTNIHKHDNHS